jgi:RNA polymerase sigma-70 factor (ECF subfamily)
MATAARAEVEARIRAAWDRGDHKVATHLIIEGYGPEILGFLVALVHDSTDADDVFATFCEDVWRGIAGFGWRCSARCWSYTLARHAAFRFLRSRQTNRRVPLSSAPDVEDRLRTTTALHARSEVKSEMRRLREELPIDEQAILILRVDKDLSWEEVARVLDDGESDSDMARSTVRVRKRFQLVKNKLRRMAQEAGLL